MNFFSQHCLRNFLVVVSSMLSISFSDPVVVVAAQEPPESFPVPSEANQGAATIRAAQDCIQDCGEYFLPGNTTTNVLQTCLTDRKQEQVTSAATETVVTMDVDFEECCGITTDGELLECAGTLTAAQAVLMTRLVSIQSSAANYLTCMAENYGTDRCRLPGNCTSIVVGWGTGIGFANDVDMWVILRYSTLGPPATSSLANLARTTDASCTVMDAFGSNACDMVQGCCTECAPLIAAVVNAVTDELLLPIYSDTVTTCGGKKMCIDYGVTPVGRHRLLAANNDPKTGIVLIIIPIGWNICIRPKVGPPPMLKTVPQQ